MVRRYDGDTNNNEKAATKNKRFGGLFGTYWDNWIMNGDAGNDTLIGGGKSDTINGGTGADYMQGGDGNDRYYVDNLGDVINEGSGRGTDHVISKLSSFTLPSNVETLDLEEMSYSYMYGIGNSLNNKIYGTDSATHDRLYGNDGNDELHGFNRDDSLYGGTGHDALYGGNDNDYLEGGEGYDTLYGGNGNDTLVGNRKGDGTSFEADRLYGGAGSDLFVLGDKNVVISYNDRDSADRAEIHDFQPGVDKLQLGGDRRYHVVNNNYLYFDHDRNGSLNTGDDMIAVFHGVTESQLVSAVNSAKYV